MDAVRRVGVLSRRHRLQVDRRRRWGVERSLHWYGRTERGCVQPATVGTIDAWLTSKFISVRPVVAENDISWSKQVRFASERLHIDREMELNHHPGLRLSSRRRRVLKSEEVVAFVYHGHCLSGLRSIWLLTLWDFLSIYSTHMSPLSFQFYCYCYSKLLIRHI